MFLFFVFLIFLLRRGSNIFRVFSPTERFKPLRQGGTTHFFLDLQEKSSKKEVGELAVRSLFCDRQLSRISFFVPKRAVHLDRVAPTPESKKIGFPLAAQSASICRSHGARPSLSRALSPARRMGTDRRGAWEVKFNFLNDYKDKREFSDRLR